MKSSLRYGVILHAAFLMTLSLSSIPTLFPIEIQEDSTEIEEAIEREAKSNEIVGSTGDDDVTSTSQDLPPTPHILFREIRHSSFQPQWQNLSATLALYLLFHQLMFYE